MPRKSKICLQQKQGRPKTALFFYACAGNALLSNISEKAAAMACFRSCRRVQFENEIRSEGEKQAPVTDRIPRAVTSGGAGGAAGHCRSDDPEGMSLRAGSHRNKKVRGSRRENSRRPQSERTESRPSGVLLQLPGSVRKRQSAASCQADRPGKKCGESSALPNAREAKGIKGSANAVRLQSVLSADKPRMPGQAARPGRVIAAASPSAQPARCLKKFFEKRRTGGVLVLFRYCWPPII